MGKRKEAIISELTGLAEVNNWHLQPKAVVDFARENQSSALHRCFNWDDTEAAERWRLHQARNLIRVTVVLVGKEPKTCKAFISLKANRKSRQGYTPITIILKKKALRDAMLKEALIELNAFKVKYALLSELCSEVGQVIKKFARPKGKIVVKPEKVSDAIAVNQ